MDQNKDTSSLMHGFQTKNFFSMKIIGVLILIALLGVGTGFVLAKTGGNSSAGIIGNGSNSGTASVGKIVGSDDTKTFKDTAEGILKPGGIGDEGQFHLERDGGPARYVYLISSLVDLSQFTGKKVKVWGQTQKAQKAGWLMDVGRVEVLK